MYASGSLLALWDLDQTSRLARPLGAELEDTTTAANLPALAVTDDGRRVVWANQSMLLGVTDGRSGKVLSRAQLDTFVDPGLVLEDGGKTAIGGQETSRIDVATGARTPIRMPDDDEVPRWLVAGKGGATIAAYDNGTVAKIPRGATEAQQLAGPIETDDFLFSSDLVAATETDDVFVATEDKLWHVDAESGRRTEWPAGGQERVLGLAVSPDGRTLATSDGLGTVLIWDARSRRVTRRIDTDASLRVALSPDGRYLVAVASDGTVGIYSLENGALLGELNLGARETFDVSQPGSQTVLRFTPDGTLWTVTSGGSLLRWDLSADRFLRSACSTVGRALTKDEWARYTSIAYDPQWKCPTPSGS